MRPPDKQPQRKASGKKAAVGRKTVTMVTANIGRDWPEGVGTVFKPIKRPVTLRLDADVLAWFKARGRGYQTRINLALRQAMAQQRKRR